MAVMTVPARIARGRGRELVVERIPRDQPVEKDPRIDRERAIVGMSGDNPVEADPTARAREPDESDRPRPRSTHGLSIRLRRDQLAD